MDQSWIWYDTVRSRHWMKGESLLDYRTLFDVSRMMLIWLYDEGNLWIDKGLIYRITGTLFMNHGWLMDGWQGEWMVMGKRASMHELTFPPDWWSEFLTNNRSHNRDTQILISPFINASFYSSMYTVLPRLLCLGIQWNHDCMWLVYQYINISNNACTLYTLVCKAAQLPVAWRNWYDISNRGECAILSMAKPTVIDWLFYLRRR